MSEKHDAMWGGGTGSAGEYIAQQEAEIARLTRLNEKLGASFDLQIEHRVEQINRLESYNARLRAALEPCIPFIEGRVGDPVAIGERAKAALANEQEGK